MSLTPEGRVKEKVTRALKAMGAYYFFPVASPMYGKRGVPDIVVCLRGVFIGIECKAGKNSTTELQDRELAKIRAAGGEAVVCSDANVNEVIEWLKTKA
jgi:Holliday junction resolvase